MATWLLLCVCLVLCSGELSKKHNRLLELSKNGTKAMSWTTGKYRKFLKTTTERPYAVITLFNAKDERYGCQVCRPVEQLVLTAAKAYGLSKSSFPAAIPDLFFAVVDINDAHVIFQENQINTVPFLVYFPADESNPKAKVLEKESSIGSLREILQFIASKHQIAVPKPVDSVRAAALVLMCAVVVAIVATFSTFYPDTVFALPWSRTVWMIGSFAIYFTGISGLIFCIIRSPPTFLYQNAKQYQFIHTNGRQQFLYEGFIVGTVQLGAAGAMILLGRSAKVTNRGLLRLRKFWLSILMMAIFIYLWSTLGKLYSRKNQWYKPAEMMPEPLQLLLFGPIKGSKGLVKWIRKFIKLGTAWISNYTTLPAFLKKAKTLMKP